MSNSVVFLLIAVGLSALGAFAVWLHGRPRRSRSSVEMFSRSLQALATTDERLEPLSGVTLRGPDPTPPPRSKSTTERIEVAVPQAATGVDGQPRATRSPRPSPRPRRASSPRPVSPRRAGSSQEGMRPGS